VEVHSGIKIVLLKKEYRNCDYPTFISVLQTFLNEARLDRAPDCGCFAVAGPVADNKVRFTNRDSWSIDGDEVAERLNIRKVLLINDFLAVGYGILTLNEEKECIVLQSAEKRFDAPIACIGAGTGLGECFLTPDQEGHYSCFPCEGGHAEFAPRSELEVELLHYLKDKFAQKHRISVERVVSGSGLANVYEFLTTKYPEKVDAALYQKISDAGDLKGKIIAQNAPQNELCHLTMSIFAGAYGAEAGVAALKWLPFGGLYLTGGLTPKNIDWISDKNGVFMHALLDKGRVSGMLHNIPIYAVMVEDLGERGAEYMGLKLAGEQPPSVSHKRPAHSADASVASPAPAPAESQGLQLEWAAIGVALLTVAFVVGRNLRR
jgi:glucokinase